MKIEDAKPESIPLRKTMEKPLDPNKPIYVDTNRLTISNEKHEPPKYESGDLATILAKTSDSDAN